MFTGQRVYYSEYVAYVFFIFFVQFVASLHCAFSVNEKQNQLLTLLHVKKHTHLLFTKNKVFFYHEQQDLLFTSLINTLHFHAT